MRTLKKLEARIKMLECEVRQGHHYTEGCFIGYERCVATVTLKCLFCKYELTKTVSELNEKEKEAAIRLGLIPKEKERGG